jgi:TonB family protein
MSQRNVATDVNHWLIHQAACRAPRSLSQRLEEEWLADLAARPSAMSRLRFAIGCCWATQVIAFEYRPSSIPVTSSAVQGRLMSAYAQHDVGKLSSRSSTLFLVVSLHAALFYGLLTTLSHIHGSVIPAPLQNRLLDNPHPLQLPPSLPEPQLNRPTIKVPTPDFDVPREPDPSQVVTADYLREPLPPDSRPSVPVPIKRVQGGPGAGFPNPDDFYPALARRMEEQGIVTVRVCVDVNGRLTSDPIALQGTGSARLDEGALNLARAGSGHYRATTQDGQLVNSCYPFRIRFQLRN